MVGNAFTYQGQLKLDGAPVDGSADLVFVLTNAGTDGSSIGPVLQFSGYAIKDGLFSVNLDFGSGAFDGTMRWLEIRVRFPAWDGSGTEPSFVTLEPRQRVNPAPYALALPGMLIEQNETSPNVVGGWTGNFASTGVVGATVSGGGDPTDDIEYPDFNAVTDHFGTVGGGSANVAGDFTDPVTSAKHATVGGGFANRATGGFATIPGGMGNWASAEAATVVGGTQNAAHGVCSLAAGTFAVANHDNSFVWSDGAGAPFNSTADRQFLISASGGVGIGTNAPQDRLHLRGGMVVEAINYGNNSCLRFKKFEHSILDSPAVFAFSHRTDGTELWMYGDGDEGYHNFQSWDYADNVVKFPASGSTLLIDMAQNRVGIGTDSPSEQLSVAGAIESTSGGFKFPDGSVQTTAATGSGSSVWSTSGDNAYYTTGNVGIGYNDPNRKLYILEDAEDIALSLKLDNPHPAFGQSGVGILFSVGGSGGGPISDTRGKGALAYEYAATWNRGNFHFLQNNGADQTNPTLADSVMTITHDGTVGIGTVTPGGVLALGDYSGGTGTSLVQEYTKQLVLAGEFNEGPNTGQSVKLLISEYDNDDGDTDIYPIYVEDENNSQHFYLRHQGGSSGGTKTAYFGGNVGIGTTDLTSSLTVQGTIESKTGGIKFPDGTVQNTAAVGGTTSWNLTGNSGTTPATHFVGTTDNASLSFRVNNVRGFLIAPRTYGPNLIGGYSANSVGVGVSGATIGGGGGRRNSAPLYYGNTVEDDFGTIAGGWHNQAGNGTGTVSDAEGATVGGGFENTASGFASTVGGGEGNNATDNYATIPGGMYNEAGGRYSFAAGYRAKANHDGTFVWADSGTTDFASAAENQFLIMASGGTAVGDNSAHGYDLFVNGSAAKPGGGSWSNYSDARVKKNVESLDGALEQLLRLRGVTFEYKEPYAKFGTSGRQIGLIAQEVEKVFPDWVDEAPNGDKWVTVRGLEALVVEALRDLRTERAVEIERLQETIAQQQTLIDSLLRRMEALEQNDRP